MALNRLALASNPCGVVPSPTGSGLRTKYMDDMQHIFVISSARSGTNFLNSILDGNENFLPVGEIFKANCTELEFNGLLVRAPDELRSFCESAIREICATNASHRLEQLKRLASQVNLEEKILVVKVFVEHLFDGDLNRDTALTNYIHDIAGKENLTIFLYRDLVFNTYSSLKLAERNSNWIDKQHSSENSLFFQPDEYLAWRDWYIKSWKNSLELTYSNVRKPFISVRYEEMAASVSETIQKFAKSLEFGPLLAAGGADFSPKTTIKQTLMPHENYYHNQAECAPYISDSLSALLLSSYDGGLRKTIAEAFDLKNTSNPTLYSDDHSENN